MSDVYAQLAAHFDRHHVDPRGLEYLTGQQVITRLNQVVGPGNWSFEVREHDYDQEADEVWVLGRFEAIIDGMQIRREQFGSQKHTRLKSNGKIVDCGFDLKGATTDALKKCATLIGVGLYLSEKEGGIPQERPAASSPQGAVVTSVRARIYQAYADLCEEAARFEVPYEMITLPIEREKLVQLGIELRQAVGLKKP